VHRRVHRQLHCARRRAELLKPEGSSANFAWLTRDIAPSGVMGDPSPATAENGEQWSNEAAARIAEILSRCITSSRGTELDDGLGRLR
jgi:creatinine amidohydrolase/Fe(II)-dependent formamide hydrolase-like protein